MSKTRNAFKQGKAFIPFLTAGDPDLDTTLKLLECMTENGADLIEIGIPFSDPVSEGIVIQKADERALNSGTTTDKIFLMVEQFRQNHSIPLAFMTYINPIFVYGVEHFAKRCSELDIDAIIVPDIPFEEKEEIHSAFYAYGIDVISLIAPTSKDRIQKIAKEAEGFVYCVSSMGVTGVRSTINKDVGKMIKEVKKVNEIPCAIGFGISTPAQAKEMAELSDGVIVGSAIVRIIEKYGTDSVPHVAKYVKEMKEAIL